MSKEEIKNKHFERNEFGFLVITDRGIDKCMDEYEKQESEKKTVAFLDSIRDYERENGTSICYDDRSSSDLFKHWIENVYNK